MMPSNLCAQGLLILFRNGRFRKQFKQAYEPLEFNLQLDVTIGC
jgi:hypothetical protein